MAPRYKNEGSGSLQIFHASATHVYRCHDNHELIWLYDPNNLFVVERSAYKCRQKHRSMLVNIGTCCWFSSFPRGTPEKVGLRIKGECTPWNGPRRAKRLRLNMAPVVGNFNFALGESGNYIVLFLSLFFSRSIMIKIKIPVNRHFLFFFFNAVLLDWVIAKTAAGHAPKLG